MAEITIRLDVSPAVKALDDLKRKQIPIALAQALTRTAQAGQAEIRRDLPSRFTIRSPFIARNVRIEAARKSDPVAAVFWRGPQGSRFGETLARHEVGGKKHPQRRYLAIPRGVKRGSGGKIPKSQRPGALLKRKRVFTQEVAGGKAVFRRESKGRNPTLLYFLTPRPANIVDRFEFKAQAERVARAVFRKEFGRAFAKAIRTAR